MKILGLILVLGIFSCKTESEVKSIPIGAQNLFKKHNAKKKADFLLFPAVLADLECERAVIPIYSISREKTKTLDNAIGTAESLASFHKPYLTISCGVKCPHGIEFSNRTAQIIGGKLLESYAGSDPTLINATPPGVYSNTRMSEISSACKHRKGPKYRGVNVKNFETHLDEEFAVFDQYGPEDAPFENLPHSKACFSLGKGICFESSIEDFTYSYSKNDVNFFDQLRESTQVNTGPTQRDQMNLYFRLTKGESRVLVDYFKTQFTDFENCNIFAPSQYRVAHIAKSIGIGLKWLFYGTCIGAARMVSFKVRAKVNSWRRKRGLPLLSVESPK